MVSLLINDFQSICFVGNKVGWTDGRKTSVGYSYFCGVVLERKPSWTLSAHDLATETSCESTSIVPTATPYIFFAKLLILWIETQLKAKCTKRAKRLQIVKSFHEIIVIRYICVIFECPLMEIGYVLKRSRTKNWPRRLLVQVLDQLRSDKESLLTAWPSHLNWKD